MLLPPAAVLVLFVWRLGFPRAGVAFSLPAFYLVARSWEALMRIVQLVRERSVFAAAVPATIELSSPQIREVNWWSLRKAGFDCLKPVDVLRDPDERLAGRPWRILTKGTTVRIPVIRKHRGDRVWRPQHVVRIAAYCRLIETCEGGQAPFGVLMFAGSYDCWIIPNTALAQSQFEQALARTREFLSVHEKGKFVPAAPTDNRCDGCHLGEPRVYASGQTDTIVSGNCIAPLLTRGAYRRLFHCPCGDCFNWVPPHEDAIRLGLVELP
jgi:hypothetical protein